ncbi:cytochrome c oxidase subunit 6C-like [Haemaphysalis longicornis]|uniref:Mitochondrial cytochrome c oxidase subunit VIc/VIIs domain-containing protein n=1 Tax=Haemaphysalis longicornis TaxID=44386 RepID=A0A9J6FML6_HAELO|nr:hypothetical protein HPB48_011957 [Haemaphysalis longicornis]
MSALPRPQFHGLLKSHLRKHIAISLTLAAAAGVAWRIFVCDARKKRYAEFYKNYDPEAEFDKMDKLGVFQSSQL